MVWTCLLSSVGASFHANEKKMVSLGSSYELGVASSMGIDTLAVTNA